LIGINDLLQEFYSIYGRSFYSRYDYEEVPSEGANALVNHLDKILKSGSLDKTVHISASTSTKFTVSGLHYFEYKDPIDQSISKGHGQVIDFTDGSRVVFRLSSQGTSTVRMYVERYVPADAGPAELAKPVAEGLRGLIEVALAISNLEEFLGRNQPTVITVSYCHQYVCHGMTNDRFSPPQVTNVKNKTESIEFIRTPVTATGSGTGS
jgi:phosphoglucomutase